MVADSPMLPLSATCMMDNSLLPTYDLTSVSDRGTFDHSLRHGNCTSKLSYLFFTALGSPTAPPGLHLFFDSGGGKAIS